MSVASTESQWPESAEWTKQKEELKAARSLSQIILLALSMGLVIARWMVENELERRAEEKRTWPLCQECGKRLNSKGWEPREMETLVGKIR